MVMDRCEETMTEEDFKAFVSGDRVVLGKLVKLSRALDLRNDDQSSIAPNDGNAAEISGRVTER